MDKEIFAKFSILHEKNVGLWPMFRNFEFQITLRVNEKARERCLVYLYSMKGCLTENLWKM